MDHDAEGTFFGALAQASKPPKRVFLRKGKKKTKDQHAVKLLKSQKLMKQLLETPTLFPKTEKHFPNLVHNDDQHQPFFLQLVHHDLTSSIFVVEIQLQLL